ncbi:hypothetical protein AKJ51_04300 [candidate division MSBL1 archaeon SCGC-AAA382A20]|uniref:Mth938-like domain-containing protein n=1 Tax=candidate division MSBL1 archaeon SCGC-AAA382A20 TaxID=1698280 RepID=A0A133VHX5_9EURY|nr:hypothetical protein AKJ51_04300 [candidate division MSBL1 archaeon SCGC-AAA382A20]
MIDSYTFGRIVIDGETYTNDVIIFPNRVKDNWWRKEGHILNPEDLKEVSEESPEVLIVGKGANGRLTVPPETRDYIESQGVDLIVEKSDKATETYNEIKDKKKVVAAFHLTC